MAIQEAPPITSTNSGRKLSMVKSYPKLWKLVTLYTKKWCDDGYEIPSQRKNKTDFKTLVTKHILAKRIYLPMQDIKEEEMLKGFLPGQAKAYFYDIDIFEKFAHDVYRIDHAAQEVQSYPTMNDTIRLFGIAALSQNRDVLISLNSKKNYARTDIDESLSRENRIFNDFAIQFNDPDLEVTHPPRAHFLETYLDLDPNDEDRISIDRDHEWVKGLYFSTLKDYLQAMTRWTKGTGGGPGSDENYCNWEDREEEGFSNYSSVGKGDTLAWVYMKDKAMGFLFGNMFQKTRDEYTLEDGRDSPKKKRPKTNSQQQATELGKIVGKSMETGFSLVADAFRQVNQVKVDANAGLTVASEMLSSALDLINKTQKQIQDFELKIDELREEESYGEDDEEVDKSHLKTLKGTLKKAFKILASVQVE